MPKLPHDAGVRALFQLQRQRMEAMPKAESRNTWLLLAGCLVLFVLLRARWVGHLLIWDEAMALCTTRAFTAGGDDPFAAWLWRHPPLHTAFLLLLQPLERGFAERAEVFSILVGAANLLILVAVNWRVFGPPVALWSAFITAVAPGSVFFDVWIKQDNLVITFGLLSLWALSSERTLLAGLCLGLALLAKGTAAFYCFAVFLLWLSGVKAQGSKLKVQSLKQLATIILFSALICGWWYLGVVPRVGAAGTDTFSFALSARSLWQQDWSFYLQQVPTHLGLIGAALAAVGLVVCIGTWRKFPANPHQWWPIWPLCLLVPALLLISLLPNKVPWIVIGLFPAWATLAGMALARLKLRPLLITMLAGLVGGLLVFSAPSDYESMLRRVAETQWRGAAMSKEAAMALNRRLRDDDGLLLTSFHYWKGIPPGLPDPIFTYYLEKKPRVLLRSHQATAAQFLNDVRTYHLDWAMLSPEPGEAAEAIFSGFNRAVGPPAERSAGAWLYRTTELPTSLPIANTD